MGFFSWLFESEAEEVDRMMAETINKAEAADTDDGDEEREWREEDDPAYGPTGMFGPLSNKD